MTKSEFYFIKHKYKLRDKKKCQNCKKEFGIYLQRDFKRKRFCSHYCQGKYIDSLPHYKRIPEWVKKKMCGKRPQFSGEKNHAYKDGRGTFRKRVLATKPKLVCAICLKPLQKKQVVIHHKIPAKRDNTKIGRPIVSGDNSEKNGQILCKSCHKRLHTNLSHRILQVA